MSSRSRYNTPPNAPGFPGHQTQHEVEKLRRGTFERGLDVTGDVVITGSTGIGTTSISSTAKLQVDSTTKGFLPPRMTTAQREAITSPDDGLVVYDTTVGALYCHEGGSWVQLSASGGGVGDGAVVIQSAPPQLALKQVNLLDRVELEYRSPADAVLAKLQFDGPTFFWNLLGLLGVPRIVGVHTAAPADSLVVNSAGSLGVGTATVSGSAKLQVESTSKGFLPPRMTTAQRLAISNPAEGLQVYDTDLDCLFQMGPLTWLPVSRSPHVIDLVDDFLGGSQNSTTIGELGWFTSGGSTIDGSEIGRPGITIRSASNDLTFMALNKPIFAANLRYLCWIIKTDVSLITNTRIRVGLSSDAHLSTPSYAIHFKYDATTDTTWQCQTYNNGVATTTNSGTAVAANTWYRFEVTYDGTTVRFYINGTLVASHTTNIPTGSMRWYSQLESTTSSPRTLGHDYTRLVLTMAR